MKTAHQALFGDGKYTFRLTAPLILELERKTGAGIAVLLDRIFKRAFTLNDIQELIRLALIGGGTAPTRAAELVATYVTDRPLAETYPIADAIAMATWFGRPNEEANG